MSVEAELCNGDITKSEALEFLRGPTPQRAAHTRAPVPHPHGPLQPGHSFRKCSVCGKWCETNKWNDQQCGDVCWWVAYDDEEHIANYFDGLED